MVNGVNIDLLLHLLWQEELVMRTPSLNRTRSIHAYYKHLDRFSIGKDFLLNHNKSLMVNFAECTVLLAPFSSMSNSHCPLGAPNFKTLQTDDA
jgi:hypothetical protein